MPKSSTKHGTPPFKVRDSKLNKGEDNMAHLLIIELPGGNDSDIIQAAIRRCDSFTFLTADLAFYEQQPAVNALLQHAHTCIDVPGFDMHEVQARVSAAHLTTPFEAVLCLLDIRVIEAATLAQGLGLKYLNLKSAQLLRDKFSVRQRLQERGIAQPLFSLATSNEELKEAVDHIGLPVLIKPSDGYGSQNIVVLEFEEDLAPWMSPLEDMLPSRADYGLGVKANDRLLVEQYMQGMVIGCDTLTQNGQHTLVGVNEKLFFEPPSFAIRGGCFTPNHGQFKVIEAYVFALLDAVDFDCGATHIELMVCNDGLSLIEINPRLVGAKIPRLISLACKRSIHSDLIDLHLGRAVTLFSETAAVAVTRWLVASQKGNLAHVELPTTADPMIACIEMLKHAGDPVRPPMENADRIGYVMSGASTRSEAEKAAEDFISKSVLLYL
jgi:biotin carboxylase